MVVALRYQSSQRASFKALRGIDSDIDHDYRNYMGGASQYKDGHECVEILCGTTLNLLPLRCS